MVFNLDSLVKSTNTSFFSPNFTRRTEKREQNIDIVIILAGW